MAGACTPTASASADASATIAVILKWMPTLKATPAAPLTCGKVCSLGSGFQVINQDYATGGLLVHAGAGIVEPTLPNYITLPMLAADQAKVSDDDSLKVLSDADLSCAKSKVFESYFGSTIAEFASGPETLTVSKCSGAVDCDASLDAAYAAGWRSFYLPQGYRRQSGTALGSITDPVLIVSPFAVNTPDLSPLPGATPAIFGLVFINAEDATVSSSLDVRGAVISCGKFSSTGNGRLEYDPQVLARIRRNSGRMVRVPGSWTDLCKLSTSTPPVLHCPDSSP